ncbi:hypothetical protein ACL9RL_09320 [Plantibacter sp. Mn2098]|uniref:hypothetical protein n=1 Tax=Plantibacter sp. Mn2098 TaxID=3395266 RepID=UPI003BD3B9D9
MTTLVDVETLVVAFLKPAAFAAGASIGTKVPNPRPKRFVRVTRTGGTATNRVLERAQITITAEAESGPEAFNLASACRAEFLNNTTRMPLVRGVEETTGPYYNPDPDTGNDRYTFTESMSVRAARN